VTPQVVKAKDIYISDIIDKKYEILKEELHPLLARIMDLEEKHRKKQEKKYYLKKWHENEANNLRAYKNYLFTGKKFPNNADFVSREYIINRMDSSLTGDQKKRAEKYTLMYNDNKLDSLSLLQECVKYIYDTTKYVIL